MSGIIPGSWYRSDTVSGHSWKTLLSSTNVSYSSCSFQVASPVAKVAAVALHCAVVALPIAEHQRWGRRPTHSKSVSPVLGYLSALMNSSSVGKRNILSPTLGVERAR